MNIPGFTAEASLYKTSTQYNMAATTFLTAEPNIRPQIWRWPYGGCIPNCICVGPDACPCCGSIPPRSWPIVLV
jgi:hypothetical protein